ncbi:MAG: hypothetical protein JSS87_04375 [Acidobacteria bacterium]|nr:hypothetical protein [Acidobacteriota bacterium]
MALSKTTQDHDEIQRWAEARGAVPAEVASTEKSGEPGILRFMFPKAKNANDGSLQEISWDDFFEKFDDSGLELIYQEKTAGGAKSNFNKLVYPENDKSSGSNQSSSSKRSTKEPISITSGRRSNGSRSSSSSSRSSSSSSRGKTSSIPTARSTSSGSHSRMTSGSRSRAKKAS